MGRGFGGRCVTRFVVKIDDASAAVQAPEFELDVFIGHTEKAGSELVGDSLRCVAREGGLQDVQELGGGGAGPAAALIAEGADGFDHRMRRGRRGEGLPHFFVCAAERGGGGYGPGGCVGRSVSRFGLLASLVSAVL